MTQRRRANISRRQWAWNQLIRRDAVARLSLGSFPSWRDWEGCEETSSSWKYLFLFRETEGSGSLILHPPPRERERETFCTFAQKRADAWLSRKSSTRCIDSTRLDSALLVSRFSSRSSSKHNRSTRPVVPLPLLFVFFSLPSSFPASLFHVFVVAAAWSIPEWRHDHPSSSRSNRDRDTLTVSRKRPRVTRKA